MLAEAAASVAAQTMKPAAHLITIDYARTGPWAIHNAHAEQAQTEWLAWLDDDDILLPRHIESLLAAAGSDVDLIYPWCEVQGRADFYPNSPFDAAALRRQNYIPITTMVRRSVFLEVGGFPNGGAESDYALLLRLLDHGARFVCVPTVTWVYRFRKDNMTFTGQR